MGKPGISQEPRRTPAPPTWQAASASESSDTPPGPLRSSQGVGYATVGIEIRGIPPFAKAAKDGAPGTRGFVALSAADKKCPVLYPAGRQRRWTTLRKAACSHLLLCPSTRARRKESRISSPTRPNPTGNPGEVEGSAGFRFFTLRGPHKLTLRPGEVVVFRFPDRKQPQERQDCRCG